MLSIGLMSGTSMDGIDAALIETDGDYHIIEHDDCSLSYDPRFTILLKAAEHAVRNSLGNMEKAAKRFHEFLESYLVSELHLSQADVRQKIESLAQYLYDNSHSVLSMDAVIEQSTRLHAEIVRKLLKSAGVAANDVDVIGYHGQTLFHHPSMGVSVVVGDGALLASLVGIDVVNDFRMNDVKAGGQGAPFAPLYHRALAVRDNKMPCAVVNCGGISNITLIPNDQINHLIGFDTGPGNALLDRFVRMRTQGRETVDQDAQYGRRGAANETVLLKLFEKSIIKNGENYFSIKPPKSLDYGDIIMIDELKALSLEDGCATLAAFTAASIIASVLSFYPDLPKHWIVSGGGWRNPLIYQEFQKRLQEKSATAIKINTADQVGWNSQAMEAQIFAYLAVRSIQNKPLSVPGTTGVPKPLTGGCHYYFNPDTSYPRYCGRH